MTSPSKLIPLAQGAFAIGTESYVVADVLPTIASDLGVPVPLSGQLITAFLLLKFARCQRVASEPRLELIAEPVPELA